MKSRLRIQFLGTFQVLRDGRPLTGFRTDKIRALLAYLAVESDRPHRRDSLAALFWPDMDDQKARYNLRLSLHRLRGTLGNDFPVLQVNRQSVRFDIAPSQVDAIDFSRAMTTAATHPHDRPQNCSDCMRLLKEAVDLYRGDFLPGFFLDDDFAFAEWVTVRREAFHQEALQALTWLADYHAANGRPAQVIPFARRQLELEPWREVAYRQMMGALARSGQRAAALNQFETCRRVLFDELGLEPAAETLALYKQIRADEVNKTPDKALAMRQPVTPSLAPVVSPFIGRGEELEALSRLMADPDVRLVTITGAGGMGKTRLALACGEEQANKHPDRFPHGVCFVSLAAVTEAQLILPAIAKTLSFTPDQSSEVRSDDQQLLEFLSTRQLLLVLDNFEQLLADGQGKSSAAVVLQIFTHAPQVKLLVTSRERLHLQLEHSLPLDGLYCPNDAETDISRCSAVQLFRQSARRRQPDFTLLPGDLPHLIAICRLLEGMPLGLELAAVWVDLLPLAEIAAEIQTSLDFLAADLRDWPDRHRSMRAVFDASWARLSRSERELFHQLAVFRGGFTRAAVQAVAGGDQSRTSVLRLLSSLASQSLLRHDRLADRYTLHELLRQYAAEKLADETAAERHSRYYCAWLTEHASALKGDRQKAALVVIEADLDNVRAAWEWAVVRKRTNLLGKAAFSLGTFLFRQGRHREGQAAFCQATAALDLHAAPADHVALANLLYWQAVFEPQAETRSALLHSALESLQEAPPTRTDHTGQAAIFLELGLVAHGLGQQDEAVRYFEWSLTQARLGADRWAEANALCELGVSAWSTGDYVQAAQRFGQSLRLREALQDHAGMAVALEGLAGTAMFAGDGESAISYTRQSLEIYRQQEDRVGMAVLQAELGHKNWCQKLEGIDLIEDSLAIFADLGTRRHLAHWTVILAMYKADVEIAAAELLARRGLEMCREIGYQRGVGIAYGVLSRAAWLREDYDQAQEMAQIYLQLTEEMSLPLERSDALLWSGWAYLAEEKLEKAESHVRLVLQTPNLWRFACLNLVSVLLAHRSADHYERAWQVLGFGTSRYGRHRGAVSQEMTLRFMPEAMKSLLPDHINLLKEQGRQLDGEALFPRLLEALT